MEGPHPLYRRKCDALLPMLNPVPSPNVCVRTPVSKQESGRDSLLPQTQKDMLPMACDAELNHRRQSGALSHRFHILGLNHH